MTWPPCLFGNPISESRFHTDYFCFLSQSPAEESRTCANFHKLLVCPAVNKMQEGAKKISRPQDFSLTKVISPPFFQIQIHRRQKSAWPAPLRHRTSCRRS